MAISTVARVGYPENEAELWHQPLFVVQDDHSYSATTATAPKEPAAVRRSQQWADVASVVNLAVRGAFPASPVFDRRDPVAFQAHWRAVFSWLHGCVVADAGIATQLADPPVRCFEIRILDDGGSGGSSHDDSGNSDNDSNNNNNSTTDDGWDSSLACPCRLLPRTAPSIVLRNDRGVTKGDLVLGLARYLYGSDQLPLMYKQQDADSDCWPRGPAADQKDSPLRQERGPALPYEASWMSSYDGIWVYCCPPDQFGKRIRDKREVALGVSNQTETDKSSLHATEQPRIKTRLRI